MIVPDVDLLGLRIFQAFTARGQPFAKEIRQCHQTDVGARFHRVESRLGSASTATNKTNTDAIVTGSMGAAFDGERRQGGGTRKGGRLFKKVPSRMDFFNRHKTKVLRVIAGESWR